MKHMCCMMLYWTGDMFCRLIILDLTNLTYKMYKFCMLLSMKLDTDNRVWKNPQSERVDVIAKLKR